MAVCIRSWLCIVSRRLCARTSGALAVAALLLAATGPNAAAAENVSVVAHAEGRAVQVSATATLSAPYDLIWATLTDYGHLADFVPGMKVSRVIERRGGTVVVEQEGAAKFLVFSHAIKVTVESIEEPPSVIGIRVVKGNLKQLTGRYEIEALQAPQSGYVLRWSGVIEPQLPVPGFIGVPLLRSNVADQFIGMVNEIERRDALRRPPMAAR